MNLFPPKPVSSPISSIFIGLARKLKCPQYLCLLHFFLFFFFLFTATPRRIDIPRLGVETELQLRAFRSKPRLGPMLQPAAMPDS